MNFLNDKKKWQMSASVHRSVLLCPSIRTAPQGFACDEKENMLWVYCSILYQKCNSNWKKSLHSYCFIGADTDIISLLLLLFCCSSVVLSHRKFPWKSRAVSGYKFRHLHHHMRIRYTFLLHTQIFCTVQGCGEFIDFVCIIMTGFFIYKSEYLRFVIVL